MTQYDYKVVPAPTRGEKARGIKTPEGRFANALEAVMNEMAAGGWEYQRAETLPQEERSGLTGTSTVFRNVLVFRRPAAAGTAQFRPEVIPAVTADETTTAGVPSVTTAGVPSVGPARREDGVPIRPIAGVDKSRPAAPPPRASSPQPGDTLHTSAPGDDANRATDTAPQDDSDINRLG